MTPNQIRNMNENRYLKATSIQLQRAIDELMETERQRVRLEKSVLERIKTMRAFGFDAKTINHLSALSFTPQTPQGKQNVQDALAYLDSRMYQEKPTVSAMPGMTPTGRMPGM